MNDNSNNGQHHSNNGQHPDDRQARRRAADTALGIVRADGGEPSPEARELLDRVAAGELTHEEAIEQIRRRYQR